MAVEITITLAPTDYVGAGFDEIHLRWSFESDGWWSDGDCNWPTFGAAQVDLIEVYFDQGSGPVQQGVTEDCEGGPNQWLNVPTPGVGDFTQIWSALQDQDPCRSNLSCVAAFIDDGELVPGTGGYLCTSWCYGPSGYIVNPDGGLAGPEFGIKNEVWSPVLAWPGDQYAAAAFEFDAYVHEPLSPTSPLIGYVWKVRSTGSDNPDDIEAAEWGDRGYVYIGGPTWRRVDRSMGISSGGIVTDLLVSDRRYVQLALGVLDVGKWYGAFGTDGTPAPYLDNAAFLCWGYDGPVVTARTKLGQDNFPEIGSYDYNDLAANSIRFDAAFDKWPGIPQDSILVDVVPVRTGSVLNDQPKLYYKLFPNPLFDPARTLPNEGWVYGDSTLDANEYSFDLPDTGFFFPGDVIHFYIEGQDNLAGDIGTTLLPGDTTLFETVVTSKGRTSTCIVGRAGPMALAVVRRRANSMVTK